MSSREMTIWIDERWYDALSRHLKDETLEEHLEDVIDEMCNQLPEHEYKRISAEIWQEKQREKQEREAARRIAIFHVTEGNSSAYFLTEENVDMLQTAARMRRYIRKSDGSQPARFTGLFSPVEPISKEQFEAYAAERLNNTGRVTGAFEIDFGQSTFDALHIMDGWQRFSIQDVSTAAYFAMKKTYSSWDDRWKVFLEHLDGNINQLKSDEDCTSK